MPKYNDNTFSIRSHFQVLIDDGHKFRHLRTADKVHFTPEVAPHKKHITETALIRKTLIFIHWFSKYNEQLYVLNVIIHIHNMRLHSVHPMRFSLELCGSLNCKYFKKY